MSEVDWGQIREEALSTFTLGALPPTLALPALPHAVAQFMDRSKNENASLRDLSGIVETDTGLTLELLKHVNSAFVGLRQKAKSAQQALALLGVRQSKLFLISTGAQAAIRARKSKLINQTCFWNTSLQKAIFAREVAKLLKTDADLAFAGALLSDFLLPVLSNDLFDKYSAFVSDRGNQPESLCDYESDLFGWDHALAGASLAFRWKLPDELVCCILLHHRGLELLVDPKLGRTAAAAVAVAALLPDQLRQQYTGLEQLALLHQKWPAFSLVDLIEAVDKEHADLNMGVGNDFPLKRRCRQILDDLAETPADEVATVS
ncbi:HDOD domain-containing protein [bacterium]|nr:HDOD domain-containing protein [bacterium]